MRAAARIPLDKDTVEKRLLGVKDVATLYELWCYFAVVKAVGQVLRRAPDFVEEYDVTIDKVTAGRGFIVKWSRGPTVHYNPTFTFTEDPPWRSASLMLRPDIVIEIERAGQIELHVFDAKLKVEGVVSLGSDSEAADDADEDDVDPLKFKKEDIAKMHAYRDALPHVRSARVLYPGNVVRAFPALEAGATDTDVVGAIPLVPGQPALDLADVLKRIFREEYAAMPRETDTENRGPTLADLATVAAMVAEIEAIMTRPAEWSGGERGADGSMQVPFVTYAPAVERLLRAIYEHNLIVTFDWTSWQAEAQPFLDPATANAASVEEVRRLLTLHVRKERFVEGHFAEMVSNGHIGVLLRRLGTLIEDQSA